MSESRNVYCGKRMDRKDSLLTRLMALLVGKKQVQCNSQSRCLDCKRKQQLLCRNYYLIYTTSLLDALNGRFSRVSMRFIREMHQLGVGEVERTMRDYYETLYIRPGEQDLGHRHFKERVLPKNPIPDNDVALRGNNYWKTILFLVLVNYYFEPCCSRQKTQSCGCLYNTGSNRRTLSTTDLSNDGDYGETIADLLKLRVQYLARNASQYQRHFDRYNCELFQCDNGTHYLFLNRVWLTVSSIVFKIYKIPLYYLYYEHDSIFECIRHVDRHYNIDVRIQKDDRLVIDLSFTIPELVDKRVDTYWYKKMKHLDLAVSRQAFDKTITDSFLWE